MKFISWILIFCFSSQVFAGTLRERLEATMNEYEYNMVVEWDQKDQKKSEEFTQVFVNEIQKLYQDGLSNDELVKYMESRVHDKAQLDKIKAIVALSTTSNSSVKDIAQILQESRDKLGKQGASWNGGTYVLVIGPLLVLAGLIVYQLVWGLNHRCAEAQMEEHCGEESYCSDWDTDYEGNSYCEDWDTSYECNDVEVCLRYEKKPE